MVKKTLECVGFSLVVIAMLALISTMLYAYKHKEAEVIYEEKPVQLTIQKPLYELNNPDNPPEQDDYVVHEDTTNNKVSQLEDAISILSEEMEERK